MDDCPTQRDALRGSHSTHHPGPTMCPTLPYGDGAQHNSELRCARGFDCALRWGVGTGGKKINETILLPGCDEVGCDEEAMKAEYDWKQEKTCTRTGH